MLYLLNFPEFAGVFPEMNLLLHQHKIESLLAKIPKFSISEPKPTETLSETSFVISKFYDMIEVPPGLKLFCPVYLVLVASV
jgi:hypothetical protein